MVSRNVVFYHLKQIFCKNQQGGAKLLYIKYIAFLFKNETQNSQKIL